MAKRFGAQHTASGYSAMGNALGRPKITGHKNRSVADSIAAARRTAARIAAASKKK
jgi:hypothetical protein